MILNATQIRTVEDVLAAVDAAVAEELQVGYGDRSVDVELLVEIVERFLVRVPDPVVAAAVFDRLGLLVGVPARSVAV